MQTTFSHENSLELSGNNLINTAATANQVRALRKDKFGRPRNSALVLIAIVAAVVALISAAWLLDVFDPLQAVIYGTRWTKAGALAKPPAWIAAAIIAGVSGAVGLQFERGGWRKSYLAIFCGLWCAAGAIAAHIAAIDLLAVPVAIAAALTWSAAHFCLLRQIDNQLSNAIERLATTTHLLEGKRADARMTSGLQLLQTVLPLDEIVVFQLGKSGTLHASTLR